MQNMRDGLWRSRRRGHIESDVIHPAPRGCDIDEQGPTHFGPYAGKVNHQAIRMTILLLRLTRRIDGRG